MQDCFSSCQGWNVYGFDLIYYLFGKRGIFICEYGTLWSWPVLNYILETMADVCGFSLGDLMVLVRVFRNR